MCHNIIYHIMIQFLSIKYFVKNKHGSYDLKSNKERKQSSNQTRINITNNS